MIVNTHMKLNLRFLSKRLRLLTLLTSSHRTEIYGITSESLKNMHRFVLTWSFVTFEAEARFSREPSKTGSRVITW